MDNTDTLPDTYGGVSRFTVVDAKLGYRFGPQARLALGIDNLTDRRYYVFHPYPGRTVYAELQLSY
jgi:iron complex outermembrane receptor protein